MANSNTISKVCVLGPWNNSYCLMGEIFEHMEKHGCDPAKSGKGRCWRVRKMCNDMDRLKKRGL